MILEEVIFTRETEQATFLIINYLKKGFWRRLVRKSESAFLIDKGEEGIFIHWGKDGSNMEASFVEKIIEKYKQFKNR